MHKFIKQHKDFAPGDEAKDLSSDYLQALIDAGIVEEVKERRLKGIPSIDGIFTPYNKNMSDEEMDILGLSFSTEKATKEYKNFLIARTELIRACDEISGEKNGFILGKENYSVFYDHSSSTWLSDLSLDTQEQESFVYLRTEAQAQRLVDEHSEALKIYLGIE